MDFDFSIFKNNYIKNISETFNAQFTVRATSSQPKPMILFIGSGSWSQRSNSYWQDCDGSKKRMRS
jgi:hypothetical protein